LKIFHNNCIVAVEMGEVLDGCSYATPHHNIICSSTTYGLLDELPPQSCGFETIFNHVTVVFMTEMCVVTG